MKAEELKRGNYFTDGTFMARVEEISANVITGKLDSLAINDLPEQSVYSFNIENIQGIPLTEEWLLKFWFEKLNRDVPAYEKGNLIIEWLFERWTARLYYDAFTSIQIIEVKYVHQIQNLYFALCGEELTIK